MKPISKLLAVVALFLWFIPAAAQDDPTVYATAQRFENGLMIWRSDTGDIWALGKDGQAFEFTPAAYNTLPDNPVTNSPSTRVRPIMSFGKVWGNNPAVRDALGWATLPEIGFDMPIRYANQTYYFTQLDESVIQINPDHTWTRSSTPSSTIRSFSANTNAVLPNGTVTLRWDVEGTGKVLLEGYDQDGNLFTFLQDLPLTNSQTISVPANATSLRFVVWGANLVHFESTAPAMWERVVQSEVTVKVDVDAVTTTTTQAVFQQFEHGFMIRVADTGLIEIFPGAAAGKLWTIPQSDYESLPDNATADVPTGLVRPASAFGQVWGGYENVRQALGWATAPEQNYQLTVRMLNNTPLSFSLPDGKVAYLSSWLFWVFETG